MTSSSRVPAYLALFACVLAALVNGILYTWSVFTLPIEQATGLIRSQTSLVFTFIMVFFSLGMMASGSIMNRIGPRWTALSGGLMLSAGLALSSQATQLWQFIVAYGIIAGFGIGMANIMATTVILKWFPGRRGLVLGIVAFSLALGTLIFGSGIAAKLIPAIGYSSTLLILSVLALVFALIASLFMKFPPCPETKDNTCEENDGLTTREFIRTKGYRALFLWGLCVQAGGLMVIGHVVPYAIEQGASAAQASAAMGIYAIANGVGRLIFGSLYDAKGFRFAMALDVVCMVGGLLLLVFLPPLIGYAGLLVALITIAIAYGGTVPSLNAFVSRFGTAHFASNAGSVAPLSMVAGIVGPYVGGYIYSLTGNYLPALLCGAAMALPALFVILRAPADRS